MIANNKNNKEYNKFDVRKGNKSVLSYHRLFAPVKIAEDEHDYYYRLSSSDFWEKLQLLKEITGMNIPSSITNFVSYCRNV